LIKYFSDKDSNGGFMSQILEQKMKENENSEEKLLLNEKE
jgi:hypothetical protein